MTPTSQKGSLRESTSGSPPARSRNEIGGRLTLTGVWLAGLFACLAGVESYIGRLQDGVVMLVAEDRVPILTPIAVLYGSYLAGIIVFWFRPFYSNAGTPGLQRIRFWLALIPSAALNLIMVYLVWHNHFDSSTTIQEEVSNGVKICRLLSFLAGPAMLYYFGFRIRVSGE